MNTFENAFKSLDLIESEHTSCPLNKRDEIPSQRLIDYSRRLLNKLSFAPEAESLANKIEFSYLLNSKRLSFLISDNKRIEMFYMNTNSVLDNDSALYYVSQEVMVESIFEFCCADTYIDNIIEEGEWS